jgi:hypothetical protein
MHQGIGEELVDTYIPFRNENKVGKAVHDDGPLTLLDNIR